MSDNRKWFYMENNDERCGPYGTQEMQRMLEDGFIRGSTHVWTADFGDDWKRSDEVEDFKPYVPPPRFNKTQESNQGNQQNNAGQGQHQGQAQNMQSQQAQFQQYQQWQKQQWQQQEQWKREQERENILRVARSFKPYDPYFYAIDIGIIIYVYLMAALLVIILAFIWLFSVSAFFMKVMFWSGIVLYFASFYVVFNFVKMLANSGDRHIWRPWLVSILMVAIPGGIICIYIILHLGKDYDNMVSFVIGISACWPSYLFAVKGPKAYQEVLNRHQVYNVTAYDNTVFYFMWLGVLLIWLTPIVGLVILLFISGLTKMSQMMWDLKVYESQVRECLVNNGEKVNF